MSTLLVTRCEDAEREEWNAFVQSHPRSHFCHRFEWRRVFCEAYGLECWFLGARSGGELVGVFPAARMPGLFGAGQGAVSLPYCPYGGLLAREDLDHEELLGAFLGFLAGRGMPRVEVRSLGLAEAEAPDVTLLLPLPGELPLLWDAVGPKVRNQVRKAEKSGLALRWGRDQAEDFHRVYAENMGRLGTPVHSRRFFDAMLESFGPDAEVLTVRLDGQAVGGMVLLRHGATLTVPAASTLVRFNSLNPNMFMYWGALAWAVEQGIAVFDFGRSSQDSGTYRFKKQWGARAWPLHYRTYSQGKAAGGGATDRYRSLPARMVREVWRRLPLSFQVALGPHVRRRTP